MSTGESTDEHPTGGHAARDDDGAGRTLIVDVALSLASDAEGLPKAAGERYDVLLADGVVERVAPAGTIEDDGAERVDGAGLVALPGFTDLYGRLREPGPSGRGSLASESRAALAGGFTRVLCAPDTDPVLDDTATLELVRRRAAVSPGAKVVPMAALTRGLDGAELAPLATLQALGCLAAGQGDRPLDDAGVLLSAMRYAASFDLPLVMTARDARLGAGGCAHEGATATRLGLPGIPVAAETVALARLLELARESGCRLHLSRLSSARGVALVAEAKAAGLAVTADVGIHHLLFTDAELDGFDARYRSEVPFRSAADRDALRAGVRAGTIDAICSDHAPLDGDAGLAPLPVCAPGLSAYDRFLPLLLALPALLDAPFERVLDSVVGAPARVLGLAPPGNDGAAPTVRLREGDAADLILVDPSRAAPLANATADEPSVFLSAGRNTPLEGVRDLAECTGERAPLVGAARAAFVDGARRLPV